MTALVAFVVAWLRRRLFGWMDRVPADTDLWADGAGSSTPQPVDETGRDAGRLVSEIEAYLQHSSQRPPA